MPPKKQKTLLEKILKQKEKIVKDLDKKEEKEYEIKQKKVVEFLKEKQKEKKLPKKEKIRVIAEKILKEDDIRREFLVNEIYPLLVDQVEDEILFEKFSSFVEDDANRELYIDNLNKTFGPKRLREYIEYVRNNPEMTLEESYKDFINPKERKRVEKHNIELEQTAMDIKKAKNFEKYMERLEKKWEQTDKALRERRENQVIINREAELPDGETVVLKNILNTRTTVYIDEEGNPIIPEIMDTRIQIKGDYGSYIDLNCIDIYESRPWIPNYNRTLARGILGEETDFKFVQADYYREYDEMLFYQVNMAFLICQCNKYSDKRTQEGNIFTCYSNKDKPFRFFLVHELNDGSIIAQDEKIFEDEQRWFAMKNSSYISKLKVFANTKITDFSTELEKIRGLIYVYLRNTINKSLTQVPLIEDESKKVTDISDENVEKIVTDEQLTQLYDSILNKNLEKTVDDFVGDIGKIVSIFNVKDLGSLTNQFRARVKTDLYAYNKIIFLSDYDIFSSVYNGLDKDDVESFNSIKEQVYEINKKITMNLFYKGVYPYEKNSYTFSMFIPYDKINTIRESIELVCENPYGPITFLDVYYKDPDTGKVYCFSAKYLYDRFTVLNFINPYTNKDFTDDFIESIIEIDYAELIKAELFGQEEEKVPEKSLDEIISSSKYLSVLYDTIDDLENKITYSFSDNDEEPMELDEDMDTDEDSETESDTDTDMDTEDSETESDTDTDINMDEESDEENNMKFEMGTKCKFCMKDLKNDNYKTIAIENENPTLMKFCDTECFYKWDEPKK